jgi:hypothetical protein
MTIMKFDEYLSSKGVVGQPVVKLDGDRIDPETMPNAPPGGGNPYMAKNVKTKTSNKGLGDEGDSALEYIPQVDNKSKGKAAAKIPTVDEVSLAVKVANAAASDPTVLETVVRQLKNNGLLGALVAETLNHRETFKHLSQVMAHESYGPDLCNKLVRAMNEEVAAPFSDQLSPEDGKSEDEDDNYMPLEDGEDSDEFSDEESPEDKETEGDGSEEDMGQEDGSEEDMVAPEMEPDMSDKPAMQNLQKAMMKVFMRSMMGKN